MELKIDSEKVKKLAQECPEWKKGLEKLFPELFVVIQPQQPQLDPEEVNTFPSADYIGGVVVEYQGKVVGWLVTVGTKRHSLKDFPGSTRVLLKSGLEFISY